MTATGAEAAFAANGTVPLRGASRRTFVIYAWALFVVLGVLTTMLGPLLPLLSLRWHLSPAMAGSLFTWQFSGATLGTLLSSLIRRAESKAVVLSGLALCCAGCGGLALFDWPALKFAIACYGFGLGVLIPKINLAVAAAEPSRRAASLSILNLFWTLGAISGPLLLEAVASPRRFLSMVEAMALLLFAASFFIVMPGSMRRPERAAETITSGRSSRIPIVLLFGAMFFAYVGSENAVSGWITYYATPMFESSYRAMTVSAIFWLAFMAGRAGAPLVLRRFSEMSVALAGSVAAILGLVSLSQSAAAPQALASAALIGAGLAPVYPILIARLAERASGDEPAAILCFAFSGMGAAVLPFAAGWTSQLSGHNSAGLWVPVVALTALLALLLLFAGDGGSLPAARE